jgi:hypothetical protein
LSNPSAKNDGHQLFGCVSFFCKEEGDGRIKKKEEEMGK